MDRVEELASFRLGLDLVARSDGVADAVLDVAFKDLQRNSVERRSDGADLREDVDAIALLVDHSLKATHLALDPTEPGGDRLPLAAVAVAHGVDLLMRDSSGSA